MWNIQKKFGQIRHRWATSHLQTWLYKVVSSIPHHEQEYNSHLYGNCDMLINAYENVNSTRPWQPLSQNCTVHHDQLTVLKCDIFIDLTFNLTQGYF